MTGSTSLPKNDVYVAYCPKCENMRLVLIPVTNSTEPFNMLYCTECHSKYPIDRVPRKRI